MKLRIAAVAALIVQLLIGARASAQSPPDTLTQAQAADVLSDLLTWLVDRAEARDDAMQTYLREAGKLDGYNAAKPDARSKPAYFTQVYNGAIAFVQARGAKYADPTLSSLNPNQLADHLNTLQAYNMQTFIRLNELRGKSDSMAAFLHSIGQFDGYLKWAQAKYGSGDMTAMPNAPQSAGQVAADMQKLIDTARQITWQKAQAMGMSQAEFDQRWQAHLAQFKEQVAQKVAGVSATAGWLTQSELAAQKPPPPPPAQSPVVWQAGPPVTSLSPTLPPPVQSQYTAAYYQGADSQLDWWNGWNDGYNEVSGHHH